MATRSLTGTKTDTPLIETPQAISVVTRQQIEDQRPQTVGQAFRYSAGIQPEAYGVASNYTDGYFYVRGFRPDVYLDELRLAPFSSTDPYLLERAEIIHGPASVLYGQGSPGGTVNLVSKRPTETPFGEVQVAGGSYGRIQTNFDLGGPVDPGATLLYRLTGIAYGSNTQVDQTKEQRVAVSPAFTWRPDASTTLTVLANFTDDPALGAFSALPAVGAVLPSAFGPIRRGFFVGDPQFNTWTRDQGRIGYEFEHRFDDVWTVRQNARFSDTYLTEKHIYPLSLTPNTANINRYAYYDKIRRTAVNLDNQVEADFTTGFIAHKLLVGLDYQYLRLDENYAVGLSGVAPINYLLPNYGLLASSSPIRFATVGSPTTDLNQLGLYAQDQMKWDRLSVLLGVRQDWASSDVADNALRTTSHMYDKAATYRAGLVYQLDYGIAPYASFTTSFQPQVGTSFDGAAFKPTTGRQYEVGVKYQPTGLDSFMTVSVFNLTQQNVLTPDPTFTQFRIQTGEVRSKGVELEAHANVTRDFGFIGSYTYLDNVVTRANDNTLGKHPVAIPAHTAAVWANYTFHEGSFTGLGLSAGVRYVGPTFGTASNLWGVPGFEGVASKVPDYVLLDAAIRYDFDRNWHLALNASNLLDRKFVSSCLSATTCYYGPGQTILASLRYTW